jgi:mannonate dehydratase
MNRRHWLRSTLVGSGAIGLPWLVRSAFGADDRQASIAETAAQGTPPLRITDVKTILTAPANIRLVVVKVQTNEPGLFGLGCATFTQRARAVETAVDKYLKPFLIGKDATRIEDVWQSAFVSSYWRNGPVLGNALSGVDMALWDIKGKKLGMPVWKVLGGGFHKKLRCYASVLFGDTPEQTYEEASRLRDLGFTAVKFGWGPMGKDAKTDVALVAKARAGLGENLDLMVDAGLAWDTKTAIQRAEAAIAKSIHGREIGVGDGDIGQLGSLCLEGGSLVGRHGEVEWFGQSAVRSD